MHVGVKLLDKHERTGDQDVKQWLLSPTVNDIGKVGVGEVHQNDLAFRMNASSGKVLRESLSSILITEPNMRRSRIRRRRRCPSRVYSKYIEMEYVCMGNAWTCDMQSKLHHGLSPIQSYQHTINLHTSKCMIILL